MIVDVYRSTIDTDYFVTVPTGTDISALNLGTVNAKYAALALRDKAADFKASKELLAFDAADIIKQIEEKGYALHAISITVKSGIHLN